MSRRLEKDFRTIGRVDFVIVGRGGFGFFHACDLAALVRHTRRPDFLLIDWCQQSHFRHRHRLGIRLQQKACESQGICRIQNIHQRMTLVNLSQVERLHCRVMDRGDSKRTVIQANASKFHKEIPVVDEKCLFPGAIV